MPFSLQQFDDLLVTDFLSLSQHDTVFDVGCGAWKIWNLLHSYVKKIDGIEIHRIYIPQFDLDRKYDNLYIWDILQHEFLQNYDVIVLGDVLEHIDRQSAKKLLENLKRRCNTIYVQIPYMHTQGVEFDNIYETHLQSDLTPELFLKEYPGFELLWADSLIWLYKRSC